MHPLSNFGIAFLQVQSEDSELQTQSAEVLPGFIVKPPAGLVLFEL